MRLKPEPEPTILSRQALGCPVPALHSICLYEVQGLAYSSQDRRAGPRCPGACDLHRVGKIQTSISNRTPVVAKT